MSKGWLVGGSYTSQAVNAACQQTLNWYPEHIEGQEIKSQQVLYPRPGLQVAYTLSGETFIPGLFHFNGRAFAAGKNLWELYPGGVALNRGALANTGTLPTSFAANQANQLLVSAGGKLFIFDLAHNVLAPVDMDQLAGPVDQIGFVDTYFVALIRDSNEFQLSALLDGFVWDGADLNKVEVFPENVVSMIVAFRELWFLGNKQSTAYQNTGDTLNPFQPIPSAFMEQGCAAQYATVRMDNTGFWIGQDERGRGMAWRANGYTPVRISTHAIEMAWQRYPTISDAIGWAYQDQGHTFWCIYFPSGNSTWIYDASTSLWHEEAFWNAPEDRFVAHRARCHMFAFGKHLVGDWNSGTIYEQNIAFVTDFGHPIRRIRRAMHICDEQKWEKHKYIQVDIESGLGPEPPLQGNANPTKIFLADADGVVWSIQVNDDGLLQQTSLTSGTPQDIFLNDPTNSTTWQLHVDTNGVIFATLIGGGGFGFDFGFDFGFGESTGDFPTSLEMVSISGNFLFLLTINSDGVIQTDPADGGTGMIPRGPELDVRWSDDGGHSWKNYYPMDAGQAGEYRKRCIRRRLGRARDRVYEVSCSDPIPWRIIDAYLETA